MNPLFFYLLLSAFLFTVGLGGVLSRRNAILVLIGIELMLNAGNINLIAFWRYSTDHSAYTGLWFAVFSIGVAAAEAAVGLSIILTVYRHMHTINLDRIDSMKG